MNRVCGGTLLPTPAVDESRDYEKITHLRTADVRGSNPRHRDSLRTHSVIGCSWRTVLSVYRQRAIRSSTGSAGRFGGRACDCDTTTMHATRRRTAAQVQTAPGCGSRDMCKVPYRSGVGSPPVRRGDHQKTPDGGRIFSGWSTGHPQFAFYRVTKKKEEGKNIPQYCKNSRFGVDRVTTPGSAALPSCGFRWSPRRAGGLPTPDHPREVTL